jgi:hypothetical protein
VFGFRAWGRHRWAAGIAALGTLYSNTYTPPVPATRKIAEVYSAAEVTSTGAEVTLVSGSVPAASLIPGQTYAVFWSGMMTSSNGTLESQMNVYGNGAIQCSNSWQARESGTPPDYVARAGFFFFTVPVAGALPVDLRISVRSFLSTNTVKGKEGRMIVIALKENDKFVESLGEQSIASNTTLTEKTGASLNLNGDYLLFVSADVNASTASGQATYTTHRYVRSDILQEDETIYTVWGTADASYFTPSMSVRRVDVNGSARLMFSQAVSSSTATKLRNARVLALKVSDLGAVHHDRLGGSGGGPNNFYSPGLQVPANVSAKEHMLVVNVSTTASAATFSVYSRVTEDGVALTPEFMHEHGTSNTPVGSDGFIMSFTPTAGSKSYDLERKSETSSSSVLISGSDLTLIQWDFNAPLTRSPRSWWTVTS